MIDPRETFRLIQGAGWREDRHQALKSLGQAKDSRSLIFLVDQFLRLDATRDVVLESAIIDALGERGEAKILSGLLKHSDPVLYPYFIHALARAAQRVGWGALRGLHQKLSRDSDPELWVKLVFARAELKDPELSHELHQFSPIPELSDEHHRTLFLALGQYTRHPEALKPWENWAKHSLENRALYRLVQHQVTARSAFRPEDILMRLTADAEPHPALALEIALLKESDLTALLELVDWNDPRGLGLRILKGAPISALQRYIPQIFSAFLASGADPESEFASNLQQFCRGLEDSDLQSLSALIPSKLREIWGLWTNPLCTEVVEALTQGLAPTEVILSQWSHHILNQALSDGIRHHAGIWSRVFPRVRTPEMRARLLRFAGEHRLWSEAVQAEISAGFEDTALRSSAFYAVSRLADYWPKISERLAELDWKNLTNEEMSAITEIFLRSSPLIQYPAPYLERLNALPQLALKLASHRPLPDFFRLIVSQLNSSQHQDALLAVIALKHLNQDSEASRLLLDQLKSKEFKLRERALDGLCAHQTLAARVGVIDYFLGLDPTGPDFGRVVQKLFYGFARPAFSAPDLAKRLSQWIEQNASHSAWEMLTQVRDRLLPTEAPKERRKAGAGALPGKSDLDVRLLQSLPQFLEYSPTVQSALRAAEEPFLREGEGQDPGVRDHAPIVLEYCKALDLVLDQRLGAKKLFPEIDRRLKDFQIYLHQIGLDMDYPKMDHVLKNLGVQGKIDPQFFPLHKAKQIAATFFNGKIEHDRFKIFDGLRSWAVILILFSRKPKPIMKFDRQNDAEFDTRILRLAERLMKLQDLRNPAAHRQTYPEIDTVRGFRQAAIETLNEIHAWI